MTQHRSLSIAGFLFGALATIGAAAQEFAPAKSNGQARTTISTDQRLAQAQAESSPESATPTLPEIEVQATPPAPATQNTGPAMVPPESVFNPPAVPLAGGTFGSAPVDGYFAPSSTSGTIIDVPEGDIPGTVNVIPQDVIKDQQNLFFSDTIRNAGGTSLGGDNFFADRIFLRGLQLQSADFRKDGYFDPTFVPRDFQNIQRVEILKGPASMLYGPGSPAGMVNLITKKPMQASFTNAEFMFGSFQRQRYTIDTNDYATKDGSVMYRINMSYEDVNSFRDFNYVERALIAPSVTWAISDDTQITWQGEWHQDHRLGDQGVPAVNGDPLALPDSRYVGEPANDGLRYQEFRQSLTLNHDFSDNWSLQLGGSSQFYEFPGSVTAASGEPLPVLAPNLFLRQRSDVIKDEEQAHSFRANLAGDFDTGRLNHQLLIGVEYIFFDSDSIYQFSSVDPINAANPTYTNPSATPLFTTAFPVFRQNRVGTYFQDLIELTPQWKLLGGLRYDNVDFTYHREFTFGPLPAIPVNSQQTFERFSPRAGILFQPLATDDLTYYFNYTRSCAPPGGGVYFNTAPLKPILGEMYEIGVKYQLFEDLALNIAGFRGTRENADLNTSSFMLVQVAEERTQGAEVNLLGQITDRWSVIANYSYTDVRLSDPNNPAIDGNRQRNVPFNSLNLWTRYNLVQNEKQVFGIAGGPVWTGSRPGDLENTIVLPSYVRWDLGFFYRRGRFNARIYAENIFDIKYAASSVNQFQIYPGAPANIRAQVGVTF